MNKKIVGTNNIIAQFKKSAISFRQFIIDAHQAFEENKNIKIYTAVCMSEKHIPFNNYSAGIKTLLKGKKFQTCIIGFEKFKRRHFMLFEYNPEMTKIPSQISLYVSQVINKPLIILLKNFTSEENKLSSYQKNSLFLKTMNENFEKNQENSIIPTSIKDMDLIQIWTPMPADKNLANKISQTIFKINTPYIEKQLNYPEIKKQLRISTHSHPPKV